MKRSEINRLQKEALGLFAEYRFSLPPFARWTEADWRAQPAAARYCLKHQMGWDVTDFGSGRFEERGLVIFCVRNGLQAVPDEKPYAEKLLVVRESQETPFHAHKIKMEDIIVRGGGNLMIELYNMGESGGLAATPVILMVDGVERRLEAGEPIRLVSGQGVPSDAGSGRQGDRVRGCFQRPRPAPALRDGAEFPAGQVVGFRQRPIYSPQRAAS
jgi:D-lyxose ketol-isomerase